MVLSILLSTLLWGSDHVRALLVNSSLITQSKWSYYKYVLLITNLKVMWTALIYKHTFSQLPRINVWLVEIGDPAGIKLFICLLLPMWVTSWGQKSCIMKVQLLSWTTQTIKYCTGKEHRQFGKGEQTEIIHCQWNKKRTNLSAV